MNQEVFLKRRSIKSLPINAGGDTNDKLNLVFIPLVEAPKLPATGTLMQVNPVPGLEPNGGLLKIRVSFKREKIWKACASTGHISRSAQRVYSAGAEGDPLELIVSP